MRTRHRLAGIATTVLTLTPVIAVLAGCGGRAPVAEVAPEPDGGSTASTGSTSGPPTSDSSSPVPDPKQLGAIPADFPLAEGLSQAGPDVQLEGPSTALPGLFLEDACNLGAWPGHPDGRLVVRHTSHRGEVVRELDVYPDAATAAGVVDAVRTHVAACPHETGGRPDEETRFAVDDDTAGRSGADEVTYVATSPAGAPERYARVVHLVQVGHAVLGVYVAATRNKAATSAMDTRSTAAVADLVSRMCVFTGSGC